MNNLAFRRIWLETAILNSMFYLIPQAIDNFRLFIRSALYLMLWSRTFLLLLISMFAASCSDTPDRIKHALNSFQLEEGLRIDLVAAEPLVIDPVALAFDEDERMYVVENRGYPDPAEGGASTTLGQIALLEDSDEDGAYEHRTTFADGFTYPNGILPWRGGVFVTCAPDIYFLKDTTGDGIADIRKVILTGFYDTKTSQIRVSSPTLGLDGWVYLAGGLNGGSVSSPVYPNRPAVIFNSGDGRFHPDTFEFEVTGGKSQFGLTFDSYGRRFGSSNRHPVQQIVLEPRYLSRNRHLTFTETIENVSKVQAEARVFPISQVAITSDFMPRLIGRSHTGTFTSACGLLVFNGNGLTPAHQGNVFICEPAQNLVQRQVLFADGVTFHSELAYEGREFLASTDSWFNPVFLQHGPAGALYLADMHRKVIDHPSYVPEEVRDQMDFESGKNDGRIYRIAYDDFRPDITKLSTTASTGQLVETLASPHVWKRITAHRLLLESSDPASIPMLKNLVGESALGESRLRALWLLSSLKGLTPEIIKKGLSDREPGVREQTILMSQKLFESYPELLPDLTSLAVDSDARVRFNCALALGWLDGPLIIPALAKIAARDGANRWTRAAVLSGIESRLPEFLKAFREQEDIDPEAFTAMMKDMGKLFGAGASLSDCRKLLQEIIQTDADGWSVSAALGLAEGIKRRKDFKTGPGGVLLTLTGNSTKSLQALENFTGSVKTVALNDLAPIELREEAANLLGYTNFESAYPVLEKLLDSKHPPRLQLATVASLANQNQLKGAELLTQKSTWNNFTPQIRSAVAGTLVTKPELVKALLDAIGQGIIAATEISSVDRQRLMKSKDEQVSHQARVLFKDLEEGGRMQVYQDYSKYLNNPADIDLGRETFQKTCATCHTYQGTGGKIGPDLTGVKNQPANALLLHTLVPNYEVYPEYQTISITTANGQTLSGRLLAETENSVTLQTAFGQDQSILRTNIISIINTGSSLMPDGLEQSMSREELIGLIAFLKSGTDLEKPGTNKATDPENLNN